MKRFALADVILLVGMAPWRRISCVRASTFVGVVPGPVDQDCQRLSG
jgi:hypothetical protein